MELSEDSVLDDLLALSGLRGHPGAQAAVAAANLSGDEGMINSLAHALTVQAALNVDEPHPFMVNQPMPEDLPAAGIPWTWVPTGAGVGFPCLLPADEDWNALVVGTPGVGKSYGIKHLATLLHAAGQTVFFLDLENEHDGVALQFPADQFLIIDYQDFKWNPFAPVEGEHPRSAVYRFHNVTREAFFFREGVENLLGEVLWDLFDSHGVFAGSHNYPTLTDVLAALQRIRYKPLSRRYNYRESALNRLAALQRLMGPVYDCVRGFDLGELTSKSLVLRLRGLSDQQLLFFVDTLLTAAITYKSLHPGGRLNIIIDEAHLLYSSWDPRSDITEPWLLQASRRARKRDIRLIFTDQVPGQIPAQILANTRYKTCFRLDEGTSKRIFARSCSLNQEQEDWLSEIPERHAIQFMGGDYPRAFLVRFPELNFPEPTPGQVAQRCAQSLAQLDYVPRAEPSPIAVARTDASVEQTASSPDSQDQTNQATQSALPLRATEYLVEIARHPFETVTQRDERLGYSGYLGNQIRTRLAEAGLIERCEVNTGRRGGTIVLYQPTDEGWEHLTRVLQADVAKPPGKGGLAHQFWQHHAALWYQARYPRAKVVIEDASLGKAVDVAVLHDGHKMAVEIAVGTAEKPQFELNNIKADYAAGYDQVVVAALRQQDLDRLRQVTTAEFGLQIANQVQWRRLREFLEPPESPGQPDAAQLQLLADHAEPTSDS